MSSKRSKRGKSSAVRFLGPNLNVPLARKANWSLVRKHLLRITMTSVMALTSGSNATSVTIGLSAYSSRFSTSKENS